MQLKVLSWNIWGGQYLPQVVDFLKESNADIIGLQEVSQDPGGANNVAEVICKQLGYRWVYGAVKRLKALEIGWKSEKTIEWGNAILARHEIIESKNHPLSEAHKRFALEAAIRVNTTTLHVFSAHFVHIHQKPPETQEKLETHEMQAVNLIKLLTKENTIVMGDFNAAPESAAIRKMREVLSDADLASNPTWSVYPEGCPVCNPQALNVLLDYIFTSMDIETRSFKVENSRGSDHLPISVLIKI